MSLPVERGSSQAVRLPAVPLFSLYQVSLFSLYQEDSSDSIPALTVSLSVQRTEVQEYQSIKGRCSFKCSATILSSWRPNIGHYVLCTAFNVVALISLCSLCRLDSFSDRTMTLGTASVSSSTVLQGGHGHLLHTKSKAG